MDIKDRLKFSKREAYVTKCVFVILLCAGVGLYLFVWTSSLLLKFAGVMIAFIGAVFLVGLYGSLRGLTEERLHGKLKVVCEFEDQVKGRVPPLH